MFPVGLALIEEEEALMQLLEAEPLELGLTTFWTPMGLRQCVLEAQLFPPSSPLGGCRSPYRLLSFVFFLFKMREGRSRINIGRTPLGRSWGLLGALLGRNRSLFQGPRGADVRP